MRIFLIYPLYILYFLAFIVCAYPTKNLAADTANDPFERTNRAIFEFNNTLDDNFFKPVAKAWREIPDFPRKPLSNLATTAKTPVSNISPIAEAKLQSKVYFMW